MAFRSVLGALSLIVSRFDTLGALGAQTGASSALPPGARCTTRGAGTLVFVPRLAASNTHDAKDTRQQ